MRCETRACSLNHSHKQSTQGWGTLYTRVCHTPGFRTVTAAGRQRRISGTASKCGFSISILSHQQTVQSGTSPWPSTWDTQPSLPTHHAIQEAGRWSGGLTPWHNITQHSENQVVTHTYSASSLKWRQEDQDPGQGHLQLCGESEGRLSYVRPHSHLPTALPQEHRLSCRRGGFP